ncbi:hypothetical protein MRX96_035517 [Rhipicephalus microplus]
MTTPSPAATTRSKSPRAAQHKATPRPAPVPAPQPATTVQRGAAMGLNTGSPLLIGNPAAAQPGMFPAGPAQGTFLLNQYIPGLGHSPILIQGALGQTQSSLGQIQGVQLALRPPHATGLTLGPQTEPRPHGGHPGPPGTPTLVIPQNLGPRPNIFLAPPRMMSPPLVCHSPGTATDAATAAGHGAHADHADPAHTGLYREAVAPDEDFNVEACPDLADLDDPMNVATALTLDQHTLVRPQELGFDEDEMNQRYVATLVNNDPAACAIYFEHMIRAPAEDDEAGLKQYCFLKNTHDALHSALDTTAYQSFAEMLQHHGLRDFDECEEVIRSGQARPTLLLKRDIDQTNVNSFNSWIVSVLKSNMDLQVILDVYACASYVVEYVNKANRGVSNLGRTIKALIEQNPSAQLSFECAMRQLGVNMLNAIEMSAQEAAWFLLQFDICTTSRDVIYVNTHWPEERHRSRKTKAKLGEQGVLPTSCDIWHKTPLERYEHRPAEMEGVTFAEFMVEYNCSSLRKCQKPAVLRCRNYSIDDVLNYKREHVMLYGPFRKELDILDGNAFEKMFDDNKEAIMEIKQRYSAGVTTSELISACEAVGRSEANHTEEVEQPEERPSAVPTLVDMNDNSDLVPEEVTKMQQKVVAATCPGVRRRDDVMPLSDFYVKRKEKIARFTEQKAMEERQQQLKDLISNSSADDEAVREYYTILLKYWVNNAIEELHSIEEEKPILQYMAKMKAQGRPTHEASTQQQPKKPLRPIIITRNKIQKQVYGVGYPSIPSMTVDEFYAQRYPKQESSSSEAVKPWSLQDIAADPEKASRELEEEEAQKEQLTEADDQGALDYKRAMDDWKDENRRGSGNRKNMG